MSLGKGQSGHETANLIELNAAQGRYSVLRAIRLAKSERGASFAEPEICVFFNHETQCFPARQ
jgi:hypothetical protein